MWGMKVEGFVLKGNKDFKLGGWENLWRIFMLRIRVGKELGNKIFN